MPHMFSYGYQPSKILYDDGVNYKKSIVKQQKIVFSSQCEIYAINDCAHEIPDVLNKIIK